MGCSENAIKTAVNTLYKNKPARELLEPLFKAGWDEFPETGASVNIQTNPFVGVLAKVRDGKFLVTTNPGRQECSMDTADEVLAHAEALRKAIGR